MTHSEMVKFHFYVDPTMHLVVPIVMQERKRTLLGYSTAVSFTHYTQLLLDLTGCIDSELL